MLETMRNPGEVCEFRSENKSANDEALQKDSERDDCSSPPCKRLKQGVLPFPFLPSTPTTSDNSTETSVLLTGSSKLVSNQLNSSGENQEVDARGLVTGAPSPPDLKGTAVNPKATTDSHSLAPQNGTERSCNTNYCPLLEVNSCNEDELMIVEQTPPTKVDKREKVNHKSPPLKSAEKLKRKEERDREKKRLREEKQREKLEAKVLKEKERLEAKRKREQEKLAEKERKEKERLEKKEEEKNARMEEKRKREAEKRNYEEEQERKKQKVQEHFANFFIKPTTSAPKVVAENSGRFKPFEPKAGMSLAPITRNQLSLDTKNALDTELQRQKIEELYLGELERRKPFPKFTKSKLCTIEEQQMEDNSDIAMPIEPITVDENSNSSIEIVEPNNSKEPSLKTGLKFKLLQFHTNYRPAFYGTWRKKSKQISPRNPLKKDREVLDYEVDSDDEWEEEEPGESLSNSEGEDEADGEDDEEDDDGFFVPHGYLSDDEGVEEDGSSVEIDEKIKTGQNKKDQQLAKAKAWEAEMKRKCKPMKPVTVGCLWSEEALTNLILAKFSACLLVDSPILVESLTANSQNTEPLATSSHYNNTGGLYVPDEAMPSLLKIIHGNTTGIQKIISLFRKQWTSKYLGRDVTDEEVDENCPISKRQTERKIQSIATKERRTDRRCWYVHKHILEKFGLDCTTKAEDLNNSDSVPVDTVSLSPVSPACTPSIKQFVRPMSSTLQKTTSPELKNNSTVPSKLSIPMEVNTTSLSVKSGQPTVQSSITLSEKHSQLFLENNVNTEMSPSSDPTFIGKNDITMFVTCQGSSQKTQVVCTE